LGVWLFKPPLLYLQNKKNMLENYLKVDRSGNYLTPHTTAGYSTRNYYSEEEYTEIQEKLNLIYSNEGKGYLVGSIYVGKGSNIPRHKIKEFFKENNLKKTSLIESSDTVIFDKQSIKTLKDWFDLKIEKIYIIPFTQELYNLLKEDVEGYIKSYGSRSSWSQNQRTQFYILLEQNFNLGNNIVIDEDTFNTFSLDKKYKQIFKNIEPQNYYPQMAYRTKNVSELWETIEYYLTNPHGNIIWDDVLLDSLNSDGLDMDDNYIDVLYSMFDSKETENIQLALEMLSNVNLEKHGLTVALLLNKYKMTFEWGNGNTGSQALKTLTLYFKNKGIEWKKDYRTFSTGLFNFYKNDEESTKIIKKFFIDSLNNYLDLDKDFNIQLSDINFTIIKK
jgi:hypothetical protein